MSAARPLDPPVVTSEPTPAPRLLVELDSWPQTFFSNLRDLVFPPHLPQLHLQSAPAPFWHDVFVKRGLPWRRFLESTGYHFIALALLMALSRFLALQPQPVLRPAFDHAEVIHYQPDEYLPPLDTRSPAAAEPQKADPEFSRQPIISVPREADNRSQTIVTAPNIKLKHDVSMPNIVAWSDNPRLPIAPTPLVPAASITHLAPQFENSVIAPPPDPSRVDRDRNRPMLQTSVVAPPPDVHATTMTAFQAPQPAVIAPPPTVANDSTRRIADLNIGHTAIIAPAPQLPVGEQRAIPGASSSAHAGVAPQVIPPPPSVRASGTASGGGRLIALNLHPSVGAPPNPPSGNRRGAFAATPEGHAGASGNPGSSSGNSSTGGAGRGNRNGSGTGSGRNGNSSLPAGLYVGNVADPAKTGAVAGDPAGHSASATTVSPKLTASLPPPRVSTPSHSLEPGNEASLSAEERTLFASRKFYSLVLNMPNLNSVGGSWVIRFAELKQDTTTSDLSAPTALRKVDPAYPLQLMRDNVAGTVILYAVIHADGTVGNTRILRSVDDRIDQFASQAVAQWQFRPATKNGAPVDVEATFHIPFRSGRQRF
jgi:TonB family protein